MTKNRIPKAVLILLTGLSMMLAIWLTPPISPFEENYESLAYGDPILLIHCQISSPYGVEITYPVCQIGTTPTHVTHCMFLGRGYEPGECVHVF